MASKGLYKRGNIWWIRYAGLDHRIIRESAKTTKLKEAQALLIQRKNAVLEGKEPVVKRIKNYTFFELRDEYLEHVKHQKSFASKKGFIKLLCAEFGNMSLRAFNTKVLADRGVILPTG